MSVAWRLGLVLALVGCSAPVVGDASSSSAASKDSDGDLQELTGGAVANAGDFPATIDIFGNCTASKVAANKILTAAHCVFDAKTRSFNATYAGQRIWVTSSPTPDGKAASNPAVGFVEAKVTGIYIDPDYLREPGGWPNAYYDTHDVAVIVLAAEGAAAIASIPVTPVSFDPVPVDVPVAIMGYGCENGYGNESLPSARLKVERTRTMPRDQAVNSKIETWGTGIADAARIDAKYFFTPGRALNGGEASICPGDSGGPAYLLDTSGRPTAVVGVNAYYTFLPNNNGDSLSNMHTRFNGTWVKDALADRATNLLVPIETGFGHTTCYGGTAVVLGAISEKYRALGGCKSALGLPKNAEAGTPDGKGRYSVFDNGSIYWSPATKAFEVLGPIRDAWAKEGWEAGRLGYPVSDEYDVSEGKQSDFQHGHITWNKSTNATRVW